MANIMDLNSPFATSTNKLYLAVWNLNNDNKYELIGQIDEIESLLIVYKYVSVSTFTLTVPYTPEVSSYLQVNYMLTIHSPETLGVENTEPFIITTKKLEESNGVVTLQVSGKNPLFWLTKRQCLLPNYGFTDTTPEVIAKTYVANNCAQYAPTQRQYPNLTTAPVQGLGTPITFTNTEDLPTILEVCETVLNARNLGQNVTFNLSTQTFQYNVFNGADRTINQSQNSPVVFSPNLNNLQSQSYTHSISNFANVVYVYGQIGDTTETVIVGEASGFNRYETSTSGTLEQGSAVTLTKNNYKEVFTVIGENTLVTQAETKNLIATIQLSSDFQLNIDFSLGDSVTYLNNEWGVKENVMIRELRLQYSTNGFIAQASLGYPLPTLEDKLGVTLS
ncbi:siphovirus ReqiPepy6 Gp37-like family protein [Sarcina ventriculi]|uniref:siphovirus ReqiPepy6 Gp37-like family protein n=1 Tax=Sarcina ventriculi TaxID=1267 RepID=UPI0018AB4B07|nr:siphovirus ReqiPepy6 Gp37-like family protein [Sarcina ventriculi]